MITAWVTHFCCNAETKIGQCPLLSVVSHFSFTIVATSVVLFLTKIMLVAFSSVSVWPVFFAKSCPHGSVALRNISVHGLATTQCCQLKHIRSCTPYGILLNNITGVKTWGTCFKHGARAPPSYNHPSSLSNTVFSTRIVTLAFSAF